MKTISLNGKDGYVAKVDACDFNYLSKLKWWPQYSGLNVYARSATGLMHRLILKPEDIFQCDHINGDGLDNRRANIRVCNRYENGANRRKKYNKTGFFGVHKHSGKYRAEITIIGKSIKFPVCKESIDAAIYYDWLARIYHGDFAKQNLKYKKSFTIQINEVL